MDTKYRREGGGLLGQQQPPPNRSRSGTGAARRHRDFLIALGLLVCLAGIAIAAALDHPSVGSGDWPQGFV